MKNNLCLYCSGKHKIVDCPNWKQNTNPKGCAAEIEEIKSSDSLDELAEELEN
jgi:hypothetical protein